MTVSLENQTARYADFYGNNSDLRQLFRFDVRYRCRRMQEVLSELKIETKHKRVLDVGCGWGQMLRSFPSSCHLVGADISKSGVEAARADARFDRFASANFACVPENEPDALPTGPFDFVISSHTLEHCYDDMAYLRAFRDRLAPGGALIIFVPIEEPDYIPFHVRNYSVQTISETVWKAGFELDRVEASMYVNGHLWKLITVPSRRQWPIAKELVDSLRLATLSSLPYGALRFADGMLHRLGFGARQALLIAHKR